MPRSLIVREILLVHSSGAYVVPRCNPLLRVLPRHCWLVMPAWFLTRHAGVVDRDIPAMCVAHVPIVEVFHLTSLVGWLVGIVVWAAAKWFPVRTALMLPLVLHIVCMIALVHGHSLLVPFRVHVPVLCGVADILVDPTAGMVVAWEVEVVP